MAPDIVSGELRSYLLGSLGAARAEALEARYVTEAELVEEIRGQEEALVADYLADRLTAVDRARFDGHYLASPVHRDRVAVARAFDDRLAAAAPAAKPDAAFYGWMAMAAAVVLMSLWLVGRPGPEPRQAQTPPAPTPTRTPVPAPAPAPAPAPVPAPPVLRAAFALTLSPLTTRGGEQRVHTRPDGPVELLIHLEGAASPGDRVYDAEIQTVDGQVVWRGRARAAAIATGRLTTLDVPAERLPSNDYVIVVTAGGAERGRYALHLRAPQR